MPLSMDRTDDLGYSTHRTPLLSIFIILIILIGMTIFIEPFTSSITLRNTEESNSDLGNYVSYMLPLKSLLYSISSTSSNTPSSPSEPVSSHLSHQLSILNDRSTLFMEPSTLRPSNINHSESSNQDSSNAHLQFNTTGAFALTDNIDTESDTSSEFSSKLNSISAEKPINYMTRKRRSKLKSQGISDMKYILFKSVHNDDVSMLKSPLSQYNDIKKGNLGRYLAKPKTRTPIDKAAIEGDYDMTSNYPTCSVNPLISFPYSSWHCPNEHHASILYLPSSHCSIHDDCIPLSQWSLSITIPYIIQLYDIYHPSFILSCTLLVILSSIVYIIASVFHVVCNSASIIIPICEREYHVITESHFGQYIAQLYASMMAVLIKGWTITAEICIEVVGHAKDFAHSVTSAIIGYRPDYTEQDFNEDARAQPMNNSTNRNDDTIHDMVLSPRQSSYQQDCYRGEEEAVAMAEEAQPDSPNFSFYHTHRKGYSKGGSQQGGDINDEPLSQASPWDDLSLSPLCGSEKGHFQFTPEPRPNQRPSGYSKTKSAFSPVSERLNQHDDGERGQEAKPVSPLAKSEQQGNDPNVRRRNESSSPLSNRGPQSPAEHGDGTSSQSSRFTGYIHCISNIISKTRTLSKYSIVSVGFIVVVSHIVCYTTGFIIDSLFYIIFPRHFQTIPIDTSIPSSLSHTIPPLLPLILTVCYIIALTTLLFLANVSLIVLWKMFLISMGSKDITAISYIRQCRSLFSVPSFHQFTSTLVYTLSQTLSMCCSLSFSHTISQAILKLSYWCVYISSLYCLTRLSYQSLTDEPYNSLHTNVNTNINNNIDIHTTDSIMRQPNSILPTLTSSRIPLIQSSTQPASNLLNNSGMIVKKQFLAAPMIRTDQSRIHNKRGIETNILPHHKEKICKPRDSHYKLLKRWRLLTKVCKNKGTRHSPDLSPVTALKRGLSETIKHIKGNHSTFKPSLPNLPKQFANDTLRDVSSPPSNSNKSSSIQDDPTAHLFDHPFFSFPLYGIVSVAMIIFIQYTIIDV